MHVRLFSNFNDLAAYRTHWDLAARNVPFQTWTWLTTWWEYYRSDARSLFVLGVFDDRDTLLGAAPWYQDESRLWGRVVRILGEEEVCSDHVNLLALPGKDTAVAGAVAGWMSDHEGTMWDTLDLDGVDADHPAMSAFLENLSDSGHPIHRRKTDSSWVTELPKDWETYLSGLSKQRRKRVRRMLRRTVDAPDARFHLPKDRAELEAAFSVLGDLHQRRRRMLRDTGYFDTPRMAAFLEEATHAMFAEGTVLIPWVEFQDRSLGVEYLLLGGGTVYSYQCGMNPDFANLSPGSAMQAATIRWAIESGCVRYDMLRGDEPYKSGWGSPRPRYHVHVFSRRQHGRMRYQLCSTGYSVKKTVKSGLSWMGYD